MALYIIYRPMILGGGGGSAGITSINSDTTPAQLLSVGTSGTDFAIVDAGGGSHVFNLPSASATARGVVTTAAQTFAGAKTFTGSISASNLSGTNTGDVTIATPNGLSIAGQALSLALSSTSTVGALSANDWNTFNGKQSALTFGNLTDAGTDGIVVTNGGGAVIGTGTSLAQHVSDASHNGYLSSTDWSTFNNKQPALGFTPENVANKGAANGYAPLDAGSKVPFANLPSTLMIYLGAWNASTNTPTLADGTGVNGDVYRVSVAGTQNLGSGSQTFFIGDFIIYNGSIWQRSPAADGVISVNGLSGAVTLTQGNLTDAGTDGIVVTNGTNAVWGSGTSLAQHVADTTHNGYLSSTDWNTFNGKQSSLTLGNLTDAGTDGIVITGGSGAVVGSGTSIAQHVADTTHNGYLSSTDWNTFNGKQAAGSYVTSNTGVSVDSEVALFSGTSGIIIKRATGTGIATLTSGVLSATATTGTGNVVLAASPTITGTLTVSTVAAVDLTSSGASSFNGTFTAKGTTTNNDPAAGYIGEYTTQSRVASAATSMSTNTSLNVTATALTLTAGDWDIGAAIGFSPSGTTVVSGIFAGISTTSATLSNGDTIAVADASGQMRAVINYPASYVPAGDISINMPSYRVSLSGSTIFYLVSRSSFSVSTMSTYGSIWARRAR